MPITVDIAVDSTPAAKQNRTALGFITGRDKRGFAQCSTCHQLMPTRSVCAIMARPVRKDIGSCNYYAPGLPHDNQLPAPCYGYNEASYVERAVRCGNCAWFAPGDRCGLYHLLNTQAPTVFELDERVTANDCCNAQTPR